MKKIQLDEKQTKLFESHLDFVKAVVRSRIRVPKTGAFDFDDLYQEGCIGLCKAAKTYNNTVSFKTYAYRCIMNQIYSFLKKTKNFEVCGMEENFDSIADRNQVDALDDILSNGILCLLEKKKEDMSNSQKQGLFALEMMVRYDMTATEIARMSGFRPNYMTACISQIRKRIQCNSKLYSQIRDSLQHQ